MKHIRNIHPWMISAGLFVVIGLLASICAVFPEDGIQLTEETSLRFPTLTEMLEGDTTATAESLLSAEELLAMREQELKHMQEEQQYIDYFKTNPGRIHFPADSAAYFDDFYAALTRARQKGVRVVHYGDSQLEADRLSCVLRQALQEEFGGGGNGWIPMVESLWSQTTNIYSAKTPRRYQIYGPASGRREGNNCYGPMGSVSMLDSTFTLSISPKKQQTGYVSANYFNRITLLSRNGGTIRMSAQGQTASAAGSDAALQLTRINVKDSTTTVSISLSGRGDVYGILLDNRGGVSVDNVPLRGCSGTIFTGMNAAQMRTYFEATNTQLIIMQFGGNSMPYIKTEQQVNTYVSSLRKQVQHMKRLAPDAKIMWVGPSDMSTRINGKMQTYPMLRTMDQAICKMVNEEGCAYWSLFESMGGPGSMARWANSSPALAGNDYVHFTRLGAQKAGELLTNAIMTGYRYYIFRHPEMQPDKLNTEPIPAPEMQLEVEQITLPNIPLDSDSYGDPRQDTFGEEMEAAETLMESGIQPGATQNAAEEVENTPAAGETAANEPDNTDPFFE
ncbi:MAG: hypothetical protein KBS77_02845 [Bacteroidales bacterium]|nr:hypothetical protein [Candidatus Colicola faecequi]